MSALINLNDLSQISELIFSTIFSVFSDLSKMSISMQILPMNFGTNLSDLSAMINLNVLSKISELKFSILFSVLLDLTKISISMQISLLTFGIN